MNGKLTLLFISRTPHCGNEASLQPTRRKNFGYPFLNLWKAGQGLIFNLLDLMMNM